MERCFYCGTIVVVGMPSRFSDGRLTPRKSRDHVTPKCRGGLGLGNIVIACQPCNGEKGKLTLEEYRAVIGYRRKMIYFTEPLKFYGEQP